LGSGVTTAELREVILTSYLFDGYPTAIEGFRILYGEQPHDPPSPEHFDYTARNIALWAERGEALCRKIYAAQYDRLIGNSAEYAPELLPAMIIEGYGKVLSRPTLPVIERELMVVVMLATKDRPRQLYSHILGAIRMGADRPMFIAVLTAVEPCLEPSRLDLLRHLCGAALDPSRAESEPDPSRAR